MPGHCNIPTKMEEEYDLVIIGAGIAGLYTAFRVLGESPKTRFIVLEADDGPGGRIQTVDFAGSEVVCGAGIGRTTDVLMRRLVRDMGLETGKPFPFHVNYSPVLETLDLKQAIRRLRRAYQGQKGQTERTFKQFATPVLGGPQEYQKLVNTVGYHDFDEEDVYDLLYNYGLDTFQDRKLMRMPWRALVAQLLKHANQGQKRVHFGQQVLAIKTDEKGQKKNEAKVVHILCKKHHSEYSIRAQKVVVATAIHSIRRLIQGSAEHLYRSVEGQPFMRVYGQFTKPAADAMRDVVTRQTLVPGDIQKVIPWDPDTGVYMISYCDSAAATRLHKKTKNTPENRQYFCRELERGLDLVPHTLHLKQIRAFYWPEGTHCYTPIPGGESVARYIHRIQRPVTNVYVVGEAVSDNHGWCEGALNSVETVIAEIIK